MNKTMQYFFALIIGLCLFAQYSCKEDSNTANYMPSHYNDFNEMMGLLGGMPGRVLEVSGINNDNNLKNADGRYANGVVFRGYPVTLDSSYIPVQRDSQQMVVIQKDTTIMRDSITRVGKITTANWTPNGWIQTTPVTLPNVGFTFTFNGVGFSVVQSGVGINVPGGSIFRPQYADSLNIGNPIVAVWQISVDTTLMDTVSQTVNYTVDSLVVNQTQAFLGIINVPGAAPANILMPGQTSNYSMLVHGINTVKIYMDRPIPVSAFLKDNWGANNIDDLWLTGSNAIFPQFLRDVSWQEGNEAGKTSPTIQLWAVLNAASDSSFITTKVNGYPGGGLTLAKPTSDGFEKNGNQYNWARTMKIPALGGWVVVIQSATGINEGAAHAGSQWKLEVFKATGQPVYTGQNNAWGGAEFEIGFSSKIWGAEGKIGGGVSSAPQAITLGGQTMIIGSPNQSWGATSPLDL